jgi:hypothetical protein
MTVRRVLALVTVCFGAAPALAAQADSAPPRDSARVEDLRQRIEARFDSIIRYDLELTDDQAARLRATHERYGPRRRELMLRQRNLRIALADQMRPGDAADADSVRKLNDGLLENRRRLLEIESDEQRDMAGYLSPVQLARYREMRVRFMERVEDIRRRRAGGAGAPRGGTGTARPGGPQRPRQRPPAGRPR